MAKIRPPKTLFLDSGSFTLWTLAERYAKEHDCGEWKFYETDEFAAYMDRYVSFVKEHGHIIDVCANLDVLPFRGRKIPPKGKDSHSLSYKHLKLLESQGISPLPVVHYGADIDIWLRKYMEEGYPYIGLGGLVGSIKSAGCQKWLESSWDLICQGAGRPRVKIHGFGVTQHRSLLRFPWYSVDSTTWIKQASNGVILVPKRRRGRYMLSAADLEQAGLPIGHWYRDCQPWSFIMGADSPRLKLGSTRHYNTLKGLERDIVEGWFKHIGMPVGDSATEGVTNSSRKQEEANLLFFEEVRKSLPTHEEWRWKAAGSTGFGLGGSAPIEINQSRDMRIPEDDRLIIFYSGANQVSKGPVAVLKGDANIMLTFKDMLKDGSPNKSFRRILKAAKRKTLCE